MNRKQMVLCTVVATAALALNAWNAAEFPVSSGEVPFVIDTTAESFSPVVLASATEVAECRGVSYRAGETVIATSQRGVATELVSGEATPGMVAFAPGAGGIWVLENGYGEAALFIIPYSVYGDSDMAIVSSTDFGAYCVDTVQTGPDRKLKKRETPPVAYSGDDWAGDLTKAATVTFTPPAGSGLEAITWNRTGEGAESFTFNAKGVWTVTLTFADSTTRTARIDIQTAGFMLTIR